MKILGKCFPLDMADHIITNLTKSLWLSTLPLGIVYRKSSESKANWTSLGILFLKKQLRK